MFTVFKENSKPVLLTCPKLVVILLKPVKTGNGCDIIMSLVFIV